MRKGSFSRRDLLKSAGIAATVSALPTVAGARLAPISLGKEHNARRLDEQRSSASLVGSLHRACCSELRTLRPGVCCVRNHHDGRSDSRVA